MGAPNETCIPDTFERSGVESLGPDARSPGRVGADADLVGALVADAALGARPVEPDSEGVEPDSERSAWNAVGDTAAENDPVGVRSDSAVMATQPTTISIATAPAINRLTPATL
jgi:hypothetical protein